MAGQKIDGIEVSNAVKEILKSAVEKLNSEDVVPCLATILVGDDPASATYVKNKHNACEKIGIKTKDHKLSANATQKELDKIIDNLNNDNEVHGILVQLPLPNQLNEFATISRISPIKDVDSLTPQNVGLLSMGKSILKPCTPSGIIEITSTPSGASLNHSTSGSGRTNAKIGFVNNRAPKANAKITFEVAPAPITLSFDIFFALSNSSSSGSTNPANNAIKTANPPVLIFIFSKDATIPWAPS